MDFSLIGLSIRDKRIYETLVAFPQVSIRKIAEETGINRGSVFESIKALRAAGLITTVIVGKRTIYRAKDPEVLHEIIAEQQGRLRSADDSLASYIDSFRGQANDPSLFHFASFYQDDDGLAMILRDVLKTCRRDGVLSYEVISSPKVSGYLYNNFPDFTRTRIKQQLSVRVLRQGPSRSETKDDLAEARFLGHAPHDTGCYTLIYSKKVAIVTIDSHNRTSGVILDNKHFADIQRQLFDAFWSQAVS